MDGYQACHLDGYVPLAPSLRQIAEGEVFVDWIATASQKVDITEYELKYWEKDAQKGKLSVAIEDLSTFCTFQWSPGPYTPTNLWSKLQVCFGNISI